MVVNDGSDMIYERLDEIVGIKELKKKIDHQTCTFDQKTIPFFVYYRF